MNLPSVEHNACLPISPAADVEQDGDDLLASGYGMQQASPWVVRYPCTNCSQVSPKGISEAYAGSSHETVTASVTTYVTPFVTGTPWIAAGHDVAMVPPVSVFTNESAAGRASDLVAGSESAPTSRRTGGRLSAEASPATVGSPEPLSHPSTERARTATKSSFDIFIYLSTCVKSPTRRTKSQVAKKRAA